MKKSDSNINQLINKLCPNGVEFSDLGEVCKFKRGSSITKKDTVPGNIPVVAGGQQPAYYHSTSNRSGQTIVVSSSGAYAGFISFWETPVFLSDSFSVDPEPRLLRPKYVFYYLKNLQGEIHASKKGSGVPHVHGSDLAKIRIPVPPIEVQKEIVRILDSFTQLEAELEAELEARRKQYEYYREEYYNFGDDIEKVPLGELGTFVRGNGLQKKDFVDSGVGAIHYGQIYTYYGLSAKSTKSFVSPELAVRLKKVQKGDVIITNTSENLEDVGKSVVWCGDTEIVTGGHATIFRPEGLDSKYFAHYTQTHAFYREKKRYAKGTKVIDVSANDLKKIVIPVPPMAEQERIAGILDKFDALVNDISTGLPAEIAARRKQYEYYRNRLLTFTPLTK